MAIVPKRPQSTSNPASKRHHKKTRPILSNTTSPFLYHKAQKLFEAEQRQNRAWLHNQLQMTNQNGISVYQHEELFNYFSFSTIHERERPPLAKEGLKLSQASKGHLARLTKERNEQREEQGVPGKWTRVEDWWVEVPVQSKHKRHRVKENRNARRLRALMEKKDRERLHRETQVVAKSLGKMQIGDEDGQNMMMDEGEEITGGMAMEDVDEGEDSEGGVAVQGTAEEEEDTAPRVWFSELPIRGPKP
ncbi:MAG: hypothetical protein Q9195_000951 [Heterodermia aff. obscurata]